ncbi:MFS transporter [Flavobacterium sp. C4GT6]|uniref:MFS transporter n=1 Tax=Flavobacterium sp. C4GT6 TaxID=3103818 RepID=UPI002ED1CDD4
MQKELSSLKLFPILFGFFIMGFCDLVGISVTYAQSQFQWSESQAGFLPSLVFLWFFILSIPAATAMDKHGQKKIVLIGLIITFVATVIPLIQFNEINCYITFVLLGIGNTFLQVSLNPLLANVVNPNKLGSYVTLGQFIKAISSFLGPIIVGYFSLKYASWEKSFYIYSAITLMVMLWLFFTRIKEGRSENKVSGLIDTLSLLKDTRIMLAFIGILCIVGLDVGMNIVTPKLLMERIGLMKEEASYGSSWYFAARTIGTFCGVLLLTKLPEKTFFKFNMALVLLALISLFIVNSQSFILLFVCIIAFGSSSIFAVIYTIAIKIKPNKTNEISGLMITGVAGGAVIPPLMGTAVQFSGSQQGALLILLVCVVYLSFCSFKLN